MTTNNIWNYIDNTMANIKKAEQEREAFYRSQPAINNPTYTTRQQLNRGYGTACNPNTTMLGNYR